MAERLGVSQAQYARWENGGRNPKDDTLEKMAEIFGVGTDTLKGRDDGLEEIVELLRKYRLDDRQKMEIKTVISNFLEHKGY